MSAKSSLAFGAGCLGTLLGGIMGAVAGAAFAHYYLGLQTSGGPFFLALDFVSAFCVGGGCLIGAILGRDGDRHRRRCTTPPGGAATAPASERSGPAAEP